MYASITRAQTICRWITLVIFTAVLFKLLLLPVTTANGGVSGRFVDGCPVANSVIVAPGQEPLPGDGVQTRAMVARRVVSCVTVYVSRFVTFPTDRAASSPRESAQQNP